MVNFQKLKKLILFYKEYILIILLGIILFVWIFSSMGFKNKEDFSNELKSNLISEVDIDELEIYKMPDPNLLVNSVNSYGEINKDEFIKLYKAAFSNSNTLKGKAEFIFHFYSMNYKVNSVKIFINIKLKSGKDWKAQQSIKLSKNTN